MDARTAQSRTRLTPDPSPVCGLALMLLVAGAGCGSRSIGAAGGAEDGQVASADSTGFALDGGLASFDAGSQPKVDVLTATTCTIAIRVDNCCTQPIAVRPEQLKSDPCLVPYVYGLKVPKLCRDKWPKMCELVGCTFGQPPSRLVTVAPGGSCHFKNECETDADCVLANDARKCCSCAQAYPTSMTEEDRCLSPVYASSWPPPGCTGYCPNPSSFGRQGPQFDKQPIPYAQCVPA